MLQGLKGSDTLKNEEVSLQGHEKWMHAIALREPTCFLTMYSADYSLR